MIWISSVYLSKLFTDFILLLFFQAFSPAKMPSLSHLNLRGNPLDQNSVGELLQLLKGFTCLNALEVSFLKLASFYS